MSELTLDTNENVIYAKRGGHLLGVAWGPAADSSGQWFVRWGEEDGGRVASKDAAVRWLELRGGEQ